MKNVYFLIFIVIFVSCEKDNKTKNDYRDPYTGLFNFTTISNIVSMCYDSSSSCIDHWKEWNFDTNYTTSSIEKYDTNCLKIHFDINCDDIIHSENIYCLIYQPILLLDSTLLMPYFPIGGHNSFLGRFIGYDTIEMKIQLGGGIGGYHKYEVRGIRE